jgi:hypothetical protein
LNGNVVLQFDRLFKSESKKLQLCSLVNRRLPLCIVWICLLLAAPSAFAQSERLQKEARQLAKEARESISLGEFYAAAEKFSRASKLVPKNIDYQIGLANARYFSAGFCRCHDDLHAPDGLQTAAA